MSRANDLYKMLEGGRHPGESFKQYRKRRAAANLAVKQALKGRMVHVSSRAVRLPVAGVDVQTDHQVINQLIRDVTLVNLPNGEQMRVGRTKGETYRRPEPKAPSKRDSRRAA